jgi:hypothetical protein
MFRLKLIAISVIIGAISLSASAKTFSNQYIQFDLPAGWQCAIEGSEWVCQSENKDRRKEAIIILAAKIRGGQDSLSEYQAYLKKGKTYQLPGGKMQRSEAKYTKLKQINGHSWADALHLASEVPGFYTRYLATVKEDLGVAVTFSVTKDLFSAYQGIFDKVVATLRVFRQKKQSLAALRSGKGNSDSNFDDEVFAPDDGLSDIDMGKKRKRKGSDDGTGDLLLYGGLGLLLLFALKKMKGGKKKKKGKKKKNS